MIVFDEIAREIARETGDKETEISCAKCGKRVIINISDCLRDGWPLCCEHVMGFWGERKPKSTLRPLRQLDLS
jgi:predicted RNA-binding Zn-ribbon protein involved in translation (DUF1610 family)